MNRLMERIPSPPPPDAAPAPWAAQEEHTGDSESDAAAPVSPSLTAADGLSLTDDDDAESCSGGGGGDAGNDGGGEDEEDVVREIAVDEKAGVTKPWWCWEAAEKEMPAGKAKVTADDDRVTAPAVVVEDAGGHSAESNRLFWEGCIAHGY